MTALKQKAEKKLSVKKPGVWRGRMYSWREITLGNDGRTVRHNGNWVTEKKWPSPESAAAAIDGWFARNPRSARCTVLLEIVFFPDD